MIEGITEVGLEQHNLTLSLLSGMISRATLRFWIKAQPSETLRVRVKLMLMIFLLQIHLDLKLLSQSLCQL